MASCWRLDGAVPGHLATAALAAVSRPCRPHLRVAPVLLAQLHLFLVADDLQQRGTHALCGRQ